ncbi:2Fe-2S iron-sulfur cluster-binding protein [Desulfoscipio gibsoniae]|uniref:NADH:ubiquinone oxidoreductase chain G-like protein n=1 Tax=Desulfoscipio gibsoniae DSM 7213 TaxID=767817 RepID=R4KM27_9FIRM|nr:2Fe-2S iron-sulfur cluster-binding protein [Desulfoscipio gibsoniae]AGL01570.1 NADH:ubiquinone oxidoreductase chain G-like protein [Desulfoscipio gibsoniae DSM 7213]
MSYVSLTINGINIKVSKGTTVLDAARQAGIFIPTLCHDPAIPRFGACRICVVEIPGMRNLPASCVTECTEGMQVFTESPAVVEARKTILELLLANHPQDCLTCDRNGDCRLQDYAFRYGVKESGFTGERKDYPLDDSNPYIIRDANKCILCGRCVRTCNAIAERSVIDFGYRGFGTKIVTAMDTPLGESDCVYCGRCVTVCPVGALTWKPLAGKGRTWEMSRQEVTCTFCDSGCTFEVLSKNGQNIGVVPKEPGSGRPLCLKGRLGLELKYLDEPAAPQLKKDGEFVEVSWAEALGLEDILSKLTK